MLGRDSSKGWNSFEGLIMVHPYVTAVTVSAPGWLLERVKYPSQFRGLAKLPSVLLFGY